MDRYNLQMKYTYKKASKNSLVNRNKIMQNFKKFQKFREKKTFYKTGNKYSNDVQLQYLKNKMKIIQQKIS